jgi:hypothetical protein
MYCRNLVRLSVVVGAAVVLSACDIAVNGEGGLHFDVASGRAQDEWTRSYAVQAGGRFELINVNGRVTAEASDGTAIEVKAERTTKAGSDESARELLAKIEMREEVGDGRVRVEVRAPRFSGMSGHEIKWTLKIPRGVAVDLRTVNGGVKLTGLTGEIRARSTNGGITGTAIHASSLDAAVTNGGVDIELAQAVTSGTFQIEAVNGGVSLSLPAESQADITGRCVNGGISVSGLNVVTVGEQTRRRLEGQLNGGGARVTIETVNGGVRIGKSPSTT